MNCLALCAEHSWDQIDRPRRPVRERIQRSVRVSLVPGRPTREYGGKGTGRPRTRGENRAQAGKGREGGFAPLPTAPASEIYRDRAHAVLHAHVVAHAVPMVG